MLAVASALYSEIVMLRQFVAKMAASVAKRHNDHGLGRFRGEPFTKHFFEMVPLPEPLLYKELADKIGTLPSDILLSVVNFYSSYSESKLWLPRLENDEERGFDYGVLWVLEPAIAAIDNIGPTLRKIEEMAAIIDCTSDPDTKLAKSVVEWEKEQWEQHRLMIDELSKEEL